MSHEKEWSILMEQSWGEYSFKRQEEEWSILMEFTTFPARG
jgi:hypothetical protein